MSHILELDGRLEHIGREYLMTMRLFLGMIFQF